MAYNSQFADALSHAIDNVSNVAEGKPRIDAAKDMKAALDALLKADPADDAAFRQAIREHSRFWQGFRSEAFYDADTQSDAFLTTNGPPTLEVLHQLAAQQRVMIGLQTADEDVLISILKNNREECRNYLATKSPLMGNLTRAPGWNPAPTTPAPVPPPVPGIKVLPDNAIQAIKSEAVRYLLPKLVNKSTDTDALDKLVRATNPSEIEAAVLALNYPSASQEALATLRGVAANIHGDQYLKNLARDRARTLKVEGAKKSFVPYVQGLTPQILNTYKDSLEYEDDEDFINDMVEPYNSLFTRSDIKWAKGILGARFLQTYLPENYNKDELLPIINAVTHEQMISQVESLNEFDEHDYIKEAIKPETINSIKTSLIQGVVSQVPNNEIDTKIKPLMVAENLIAFKKALKKIGVDNSEWLTSQAQMLEIQRAARLRKFENMITKTANEGAEQHSRLLAAFGSLSAERQKQLIDKEDELHHLLNARDPEGIKHYLGAEVSQRVIVEIIEENKDAALFNAIHNSEVAKALGNFTPRIELDEPTVAAINHKLYTLGQPPVDLTTAINYKALVDEIAGQCLVPPSASFYKAFGLDPQGSAFLTDQRSLATKTAIQTQQTNNTQLAEYFNARRLSRPLTGSHKKFLNLMMSIKKDQPFTANMTQNTKLHTASMEYQIEKVFMESLNVKEFIEKVEELFPAEPSLKAGLTRQFTTTLFNEIKTGHRKDSLLDNDQNKVLATIESMNGQIKQIQESQKPFVKNMDNLEIINQVTPIHLFNPTFQGKAKAEAAEMKSKYQDIADDCHLVLDQLRRNKATLQSYLDSIPKDSDLRVSDKTAKEKVGKLRENLKSELDEINKHIRFYAKVEQKLIGSHGVLEAIDNAAAGKNKYIYKASGVEYALKKRSTNEILKQSGPNTGPTAIQLSTSGSTANFLMDKKLEDDEYLEYKVTCTTQKTVGGVTSAVATVGYFTEVNSSLNAPGIVTSKDGVISKTPPVKFEITKFPQPGPGQTEEDVVVARVNFAMAMATTALASLDGPPTKEIPLDLTGDDPEEVKYLWTALVILGEKDPKMKFGRDAIRVNSPGFSPEDELKTTFGYTRFSPDSLRNKAFKDYEKPVLEKSKHLQEVTQAKFGHSADIETAKKKMESAKATLHDIKTNPVETIKQTIKDEGPAPGKKGPGVF